MEKQILELLKEMNDRLVSIESGQKEMNDRQEKIDKKVDAIAEQTANLLEFKTTVLSELGEIKRDMYRVEEATANNWSDIAKLKAIR